ARADVAGRVYDGTPYPYVVDMSFSHCGRWFASCHGGQAVVLRDLESTDGKGKVLGVKADRYLSRAYVAFSPVGHQIAVGLPPRLYLFDPRVTDLRRPQKEGRLLNTLNSMDYSPDGQRLVLGTGVPSVLIWDLQSDEPDVNLEGHTDTVNSVAYSPCGKWILSGSRDKTVRLWSGEVDSWSCVAVVRGSSEAVTSVAWNPVVPMEFVTGSDDGSVRVWRISDVEAGIMSARMHWGSHIGRLCATGLTFKGAVGLNPIYRKLLIQCGAIDESLALEEDGVGSSVVEAK
ncbi:hypothetical protein BGZ88_005540, partial [Linnemannia elongata]